MKKVYVELLPGVEHIPLLYPTLGRPDRRERILHLSDAFENFSEPFVEVAERIEAADFILVPHNYSSIRKNLEYFQKMNALSQKHGKRIIIFAHGDSDEEIPLSDAIIFRTSQYGYKKKPNEIMMPAYSPDLLNNRELTIRKKSDLPVVGFCGWVRYKNFQNALGTVLRNTLVNVRAIVTGNPHLRAYIKGITFRRRAIDQLQKSDRVRANIIERSSYSGHSDTITTDPAKAREEYVTNMLNSDLALTVKGDGNYSYRFYEALSLGRVPLLVDTDCVLPLANVIDYSQFVLTVDFRDLPRINQLVRDEWDQWTASDFESKQRAARAAYETYLRPDRFLRYAMDHLL